MASGRFPLCSARMSFRNGSILGILDDLVDDVFLMFLMFSGAIPVFFLCVAHCGHVAVSAFGSYPSMFHFPSFVSSFQINKSLVQFNCCNAEILGPVILQVDMGTPLNTIRYKLGKRVCPLDAHSVLM